MDFEQHTGRNGSGDRQSCERQEGAGHRHHAHGGTHDGGGLLHRLLGEYGDAGARHRRQYRRRDAGEA